jgi:hypothetical protein
VVFAAALLLSVLAFVLSAGYSLRALVRFRTWSRADPAKFWHQRDADLKAELTKRTAWLFRDFAYNWEVSDVKNRNVDLALRYLVAALAGIGFSQRFFLRRCSVDRRLPWPTADAMEPAACTNTSQTSGARPFF